MLTITIIAIALLFALDHFLEKHKVDTDPILICLCAFVYLSAILACFGFSYINVPEDWERISVYASDADFITERWTDGDVIYKRSGPGKAFLIPGAPFKYKESDSDLNYCKDCVVLCEAAYCPECGTQLFG